MSESPEKEDDQQSSIKMSMTQRAVSDWKKIRKINSSETTSSENVNEWLEELDVESTQRHPLWQSIASEYNTEFKMNNIKQLRKRAKASTKKNLLCPFLAVWITDVKFDGITSSIILTLQDVSGAEIKGVIFRETYDKLSHVLKDKPILILRHFQLLTLYKKSTVFIKDDNIDEIVCFDSVKKESKRVYIGEDEQVDIRTSSVLVDKEQTQTERVEENCVDLPEFDIDLDILEMKTSSNSRSQIDQEARKEVDFGCATKNNIPDTVTQNEIILTGLPSTKKTPKSSISENLKQLVKRIELQGQQADLDFDFDFDIFNRTTIRDATTSQVNQILLQNSPEKQNCASKENIQPNVNRNESLVDIGQVAIDDLTEDAVNIEPPPKKKVKFDVNVKQQLHNSPNCGNSTILTSKPASSTQISQNNQKQVQNEAITDEFFTDFDDISAIFD